MTYYANNLKNVPAFWGNKQTVKNIKEKRNQCTLSVSCRIYEGLCRAINQEIIVMVHHEIFGIFVL